jgi:hypothetical protein
MNKTEDSNKNRHEICKNDETTPKYVGNVENILQERKTKQKENEFQKLTLSILVYDELSLNLEPKSK